MFYISICISTQHTMFILLLALWFYMTENISNTDVFDILRYQYHWADGDKYKKPRAVSAPEVREQSLSCFFCATQSFRANLEPAITLVSKVVHIMLTIFTTMLILYAQKILLLCSKSPIIMLKRIFTDH